MTVTSHSLVGVSLGRLIPNPYLALSLAFFSNFILDLIPHWDTGTGWHDRPRIMTFFMTGFDVLLGFFLSWLIFSQRINPVYFFALFFTATLPDWLSAPYIFLAWDFPPFSWFYNVQSRFHGKNGTIWGIATQFIVVLPILFFALSR